MVNRVLKVKDWLKYSKPDYDGFINHVEAWEKEGMPFGFKDLIKLAKNYNTPLPKIVNNQLVWYEEDKK